MRDMIQRTAAALLTAAMAASLYLRDIPFDLHFHSIVFMQQTGEGSMKMDLKSTASLTVTYYFDALTSAPIAAHYDDGVKINSVMNLYINDDGEITNVSTGSIAINMNTKMDSYYFFDDYFKS